MLGRILYYITWPLIWFYSPLSTRVRVIIVHKDECLEVINWFGSGRWSLPGGGIKFGETPIETGLREIKEELNLTLPNDDVKLLTDEAVVHYQNGLLKRNHFLYVPLNMKPDMHLSKEITKTRWSKLDTITLPQQVRKQIITL